MNHMTFKDKEGFDINVLAFDGESNFAILDRTSTGSPTPYVVVKGLDTESATWSNSEGYFSNYEDCVRKYKSSVLELREFYKSWWKDSCFEKWNK